MLIQKLTSTIFLKVKLIISNNFPKNIAKLAIGFFLFFNFESANASDYVFYCKPWEDQISKNSLVDNFSIELKNETLTILGGGQNSKFATLIFTHPNFYLFASPTGSLINLSRNDGPKKVTYWESYKGQDTFFSSTCNN